MTESTIQVNLLTRLLDFISKKDYTKDLLGRRDFYSEDEIIKFVKNSKKYNPDIERLDQALALRIFHTSKQQTWVVSTNERLYNILDDNREDKPNINWSIPKRELVTNDKVSIDISTRSSTENTGLVNFGSRHKNWYYSKELFKDTDIEKEIKQLIIRAMLKNSD